MVIEPLPKLEEDKGTLLPLETNINLTTYEIQITHLMNKSHHRYKMGWQKALKQLHIKSKKCSRKTFRR